jgi:hypothetical protein
VKGTLDRIEEAVAKIAMLEIKILSFQTSRLNSAPSRISDTINGNLVRVRTCSIDFDVK